MRILVRGFYGQANLGDDAILLSILLWARREGHELTILAGPKLRQVEEVVRCSGAEAHSAPDTLKSFLRLIWRADAFVVGGGGLFPSDRPRPVVAWLARALITRMLGKKMGFIGIGINPVRNLASRALWCAMAATCNFIHVRDSKSENAIASTVMDKRKLILGADLVFNLNDEALELSAPKPGSGEPHVAVVVAKPWSDEELADPAVAQREARLIRGLAKSLDRVRRQGQEVVIVPFYIPGDREFGERVRAATREPGISVSQAESVMDRVGLVRAAAWVMTMRFHGLVLSALWGVPALVIAYDHKLRELASATGQTGSVVEFGIRRSEFFGVTKDVDFAEVDRIIDDVMTAPSPLAGERDRVGELKRRASASLEQTSRMLQR